MIGFKDAIDTIDNTKKVLKQQQDTINEWETKYYELLKKYDNLLEDYRSLYNRFIEEQTRGEKL